MKSLSRSYSAKLSSITWSLQILRDQCCFSAALIKVISGRSTLSVACQEVHVKAHTSIYTSLLSLEALCLWCKILWKMQRYIYIYIYTSIICVWFLPKISVLQLPGGKRWWWGLHERRLRWESKQTLFGLITCCMVLIRVAGFGLRLSPCAWMLCSPILGLSQTECQEGSL